MSPWQRRLQLTLIACSLLALGAVQLASAALSIGQPPAESTAPLLGSASGPIPRIALAYDLGGRGSAGFNELAWEGVKRAAAQFDADIEEITARSGETEVDREERLADLADARYYPIFAIGSAWARPAATVARKYPGTWFGIFDDATVDAKNVIGIQFNDEQGAFLVGAAAALTSKTGNVGFIGAARIPALEKYEAGFAAGVRAANPSVKVQVAYLARPPDDAGFSDPAEARKAALDMYDAGADVIFGAAGDSGNGVIQAAHERGLWAIGVNSDRYLTADPSVRGAILTSMLRRADAVTYAVTMEVAMGVPKDGNNVFGLDRGGVGFSTSGGFVDSIRTKLDAFAARIASGQILVPTKPRSQGAASPSP